MTQVDQSAAMLGMREDTALRPSRYPLVANLGSTVLGVAVFLLLWWVCHLLVGQHLPGPTTVIAAAVSQLFESRYFVSIGLPEGGFLPHLVSTTKTALLGSVLGAVLGMATGLASAHSRVIYMAFRPIAATLGTIPILVASPFFLIWFGVSDDAKIALVCIYSAVVLHLYALRAVEHIQPYYSEYARTLGAGPATIFARVSLPGSVPELFGGLRAALGAAWGLSAITELLGTDRGIGRVIITTWGIQDVTTMMAGLLLLSLAAIVADALLMALRSYATRWMAGSKSGASLI